MSSDINDTELMIARGKYSTLKREADRLLRDMSEERGGVIESMQSALSHRGYTDLCAVEELAIAASTIAFMINQARELESVCKQITELKPIAWGKQNGD